MRPARIPTALGLAAAALLAAPVLAHPGGWGGGWGGWGGEPGWGPAPGAARVADPREGKVSVSRFRAGGLAPAAFGHGAIAVIDAPGPGPHAEPLEAATYQAAIVDQLARAGYDTASSAAGSPQVAEVRVTHAEVSPGDPPHKPVSGEMTVGVSNRGSMMGLAVAVDGSKPRGPLVATELAVRLRDRTSGAALWEGRAEIMTREGDARWSDQKIAARLAGALFDGFPARSDEMPADR